ncbi:MAG: DUF6119 family protein [Varibaculum sp.]
MQEINSEKTYNILLARELNGLCLDRKLVNPIEGASSIEACDVLLKGGIFIHVKNAASSAPVSHSASASSCFNRHTSIQRYCQRKA